MSQLSEKIIFNGRELTKFVPDAHVLDINIGAVETKIVSQDRASGAGSIFAYSRDGVRSLKISIELPLNQERSAIAYNRLRAWAYSEKPEPIYLPINSNGYLNVILSSISSLPINTYYAPIDLVFTAFDPFFYGTPKSSDVGKAFMVGGDAPADFKITCKSMQSLTNPTWYIDNQRRIALAGTIGAGELIIDTEVGSVTLNGDSVKSKIDLNSRFFPLEPGSHKITGNAATVSWIERWR